MSKNTERGIGLQGGSADGQTGDSAAAGAASKAAAGEATRAAEAPRPAAESDSRPVTLLGLPAAVGEREKVTALGRDVHLPAESHRVATSRPVAVTEVAAGPQTARGSGAPPPEKAVERPAVELARPEPGRPRFSEAETQPAFRASDPALAPTQAVAPPGADFKPQRPTHPADRATFDASPLLIGEEPSVETAPTASGTGWLNPALRPSIGLGITIALALSVGVVSIVRYATLEEVEDEPFADDSAGAKTGDRASPSPTPPLPEQAADPARVIATGGTAATEEGKPDGAREANPGAEKGQDRDNERPATTETPQAGLGKDGHHAAGARTRGGIPIRHAPGDPEGPTGGNGSAAGGSPPSMPGKAPAGGPGTTTPYDPDSPLPPAGE